MHWWKAHHSDYIRYSNSQGCECSYADQIADCHRPPYPTVKPERMQGSQLHSEDEGEGLHIPRYEVGTPRQVILPHKGSLVGSRNQQHIEKPEEEAAVECQRIT